MKIILSATIALFVGAIVLGALSVDGADAKPAQEYLVRVDPRLCPSPLCGGYWIALANKTRTRCPDGRFRSRCYVASAWPASRMIHDGALVQGGIAAGDVPGFEHLGMLIATDVRNPVGAAASGSFYRLRDIGVRCVREPCFSIRASRLNTTSAVLVSGLDLRSAELSEEQEMRVGLALVGDGLFAAGGTVSGAEGGRVFRASRIYLRGRQPPG